MTFTTMEHAWGLVGQWWSVSMLVFVSMTFLCWNYKWYRFLREHTFMPEMRALFMAITVMVTANSWSAWRLWRCENWDTDLAPLLVYIFMIISLHAYVPALMAIKSLWLCTAVSLVACGLAIAYTALAFVEADIYAGIVGVFDIVWALLQLFFTLYLNPLHEKRVLNKYYGRPNTPSRKNRQRGVEVSVAVHTSARYSSSEDDHMEPAPLVDEGELQSTVSSTGTQLSMGLSFL